MVARCQANHITEFAQVEDCAKFLFRLCSQLTYFNFGDLVCQRLPGYAIYRSTSLVRPLLYAEGLYVVMMADNKRESIRKLNSYEIMRLSDNLISWV